MLTNLRPLLLDLSGLDEAGIEALCVKTYCDLYLQTFNRGVFKAHDGEDVYFYRNTGMGHAFHQTINKQKGPICPRRVKRIRWIKEFIQGNVVNSELWLVPDRRGFDKRLYCSRELGYLVWLSPRDDGWGFKTAYPASAKSVLDYTRAEGAEFVCRFILEASPSEQPQPSLQSDSASLPTDDSPALVPPCLPPDGLVPVREDSSLAAGSSPSDPS